LISPKKRQRLSSNTIIQISLPLITLAALLAAPHKALKPLTSASFLKVLESEDFRGNTNLKDQHRADGIRFKSVIEATVTSGIPLFKAIIF
jgi:hypothetical protein